MIRQAEIALQIMGRAGEHQGNMQRLDLLGWGGAIQFHMIMIMSKEKKKKKDIKTLLKTEKEEGLMEDVKILNGEIVLDYKWNPGQTIGKFLTNLKDGKELSAVRCSVTSKGLFASTGLVTIRE